MVNFAKAQYYITPFIPMTARFLVLAQDIFKTMFVYELGMVHDIIVECTTLLVRLLVDRT